MSLSVYHTDKDLTVTECRHGTLLRHPTVTMLRQALERQAITYFGREGKDRRMVQDSTVIGFHVLALGVFDGETLEIR